MKLESVRELKQELASGALAPILRPFRAHAAEAGGGRPRAPAIALGVAKGKEAGDYKLAVRIQQKEGARLGARAATALPQQFAALAKGEADIRIVRNLRKRASPSVPWYQDMIRPLTIGSSVGHFKITAGTLGAFVRCNQGRGVCMLSNNHVLANESRCKKGDVVLQQGKLDGGRPAANRVAALERWTPLKTRGKHVVDAAIAVLDEEMEYYATTLRGRPRSDLAGIRRKMLVGKEIVWKVGRTTGYTKGKVTATELDGLEIGYDIGEVTFDNQIEIMGARGTMFSDAGDSGSLIVDEGGKACGLLFAGGEEPGKGDVTYANPIETVFEALDVTLAR